MIRITALFFANLRAITGESRLEMQIPSRAKVADLKARLTGIYPQLAGWVDHLLVSINFEYAFDETIIPDGAEVALFPPVSGG